MLTNEKYRVLVRMGRPREGDTWTLFYSPPPLQLIFPIRLQVFVVFVHLLISYRHFFCGTGNHGREITFQAFWRKIGRAHV